MSHLEHIGFESVCAANAIALTAEERLASMADKRTKCMVYTRVMGYHRPIESFNLGKQGEHCERVKFVENPIALM